MISECLYKEDVVAIDKCPGNYKSNIGCPLFKTAICMFKRLRVHNKFFWNLFYLFSCGNESESCNQVMNDDWEMT